MNRKLQPIHDLDILPPDCRDRLWFDLHHGLSYDRALRLIAAENFVVIRRHRLFTWYHREKDRRELNANLPSPHQLDSAAFLALLNSEVLPWPQLIHTHIFKAAFALALSTEDHTPSRLLILQRIANNPFNQEISREKLALEKRKQSFREQLRTTELAADQPKAPEVLGAYPTNPHDFDKIKERAREKFSRMSEDQAYLEAQQEAYGERLAAYGREKVFGIPSDLSSQSGRLTPARSEDTPFAPSTRREFAFKLWTAEDIKNNQPKIEAALRADPFLSQIGLPPESAPLPVSSEPDPIPATSSPSPHPSTTVPATIRPEFEVPDEKTRIKNAEPGFPPESDKSESLIRDQTEDASCPKLNPKLISHAIRRWRAHVPSPAGTPEPDPSWRDECPCGHSLDCPDHPGLSYRVRYCKPQSAEYANLLRDASIPYYTPTADELGCTPEALARSQDPFAHNPQVPFPFDPRLDPIALLSRR